MEQRNLGLIALSHAERRDRDYAAMSVQTIADDWAEIVGRLVRENPRPVTIAGWSVAGRSINRICAAMVRRKVVPRCFISLAATPPFPGLVETPFEHESQTAKGLWEPAETPDLDGLLRKERWYHDLNGQLVGQGSTRLSSQDYYEHYLQGTPSALRGEPRSTHPADLGDAIEAMATFAWSNYPICGCIAPEGKADTRHAMSDAALWGSITVQAITSRLHRADAIKALSQSRWLSFLRILDGLPTRLQRRVSGGHFFFVGHNTARQTADHIHDLAGQVHDLFGQFPELDLQNPIKEASTDDHQSS
ncbi:hypothetical protein [Bradyrhizobium valentinum]|uniref:hypothetical protein n=1 Tax=Bradyrhizobium valentinum TaxID=1518501 RepID=UPI0018D21E47|nr:hypothetical protein [Bradyrhizobium valentinum]